MKPYITNTGLKQFKPSMKEALDMDALQEGLCLACGASQSGVEPDARKCKCDSCGAMKVYGGKKLVLMGLIY